MPVPTKLGISFTAAELDAMKDGVQVVIDTIASKITINLNTDERESLSKLGDERLPYAQRSISDYAVAYPQFNPLAYSVADATADGATYGQMDEILTRLADATERVTELQMVAGHFAFLFMRKQYEVAKSNKDENVPGAQVVYDGLKGCFEGQGPQNPTP